MNTQPSRTIGRAFTLIELLVVIAIIAILAAILFPVFGAVREQTRQSSTMSNMHTIYVGASLFYQDEGRFPSALFGYAEAPRVADPNKPNNPLAQPALPTDLSAAGTVQTPMDKATEKFAISNGVATGYLYHEQVKDYISFLCADNLIGGQQNGTQQVTPVYYPVALTQALGLGGTIQQPIPVLWRAASQVGNCQDPGDLDLPCRQTAPGQPDDCSGYVSPPQPKLFYTMDSMDIGPMLDPATGKQVPGKYELHYSPDWTHELYNQANGCDIYPSNVSGMPGGYATNPIVAQLKYKNPPTENTIITWNTWHAATSGSNSVIILLDSGTARKISINRAYGQGNGLGQLPLLYH